MPSLGASAVVIDSRRVLLIQRKDLGTWSLPGGLVDPEETVAEAAVREVAEATGLTTELTRLVGVFVAPAEALPGCRGSSGHLRQRGRGGTSPGSSRDPELSKEEFYNRYWTERGRGDGRIEVSEVRNGS